MLIHVRARGLPLFKSKLCLGKYWLQHISPDHITISGHVQIVLLEDCLLWYSFFIQHGGSHINKGESLVFCAFRRNQTIGFFHLWP